MAIDFKPLAIEHIAYRIKWLNDPAVNKYLGHQVRSGTDEKFHRDWFASYEQDRAREIFVIEIGGEVVGQVGLLDINLLDRNAALYILIGDKTKWHQGIGSAAMQFVLDYGFNKLNLHKVWLEVHARNTNAIKLYKKFGFEEEGRFKDNVLYDDGFGDEIRMAKIKA